MIQGVPAGGCQHACMSTCMREQLGRVGPVCGPYAQLVSSVAGNACEHAERCRDATRLTRVRRVGRVLSGPHSASFAARQRVFPRINGMDPRSRDVLLNICRAGLKCKRFRTRDLRAVAHRERYEARGLMLKGNVTSITHQTVVFVVCWGWGSYGGAERPKRLVILSHPRSL